MEDPPTRRAIELAVKFHPLATHLFAPNNWTQKGEPKGGIRQAIVLAANFNVPVFNLGTPSVLEDVQTFLHS